MTTKEETNRMATKQAAKSEQPKPPETTPEPEESGDCGLAAAEAEEDNNGENAPKTAPKTSENEPETPIIDREITISAPFADGEIEGYKQKHIEVSKLTELQALTVRRLTIGLMDQGAMLKEKRLVKSAPDALRWLIEQIGEQLPKDRSDDDPVKPS